MPGALPVSLPDRCHVVVSAELRRDYRALGRQSRHDPRQEASHDSQRMTAAQEASAGDLADVGAKCEPPGPKSTLAPADAPRDGFQVPLASLGDQDGPVRTAPVVTVKAPSPRAGWKIELLVDADRRCFARVTRRLGPKPGSGTGSVAAGLGSPRDLRRLLGDVLSPGPVALGPERPDDGSGTALAFVTPDGRLRPRPLQRKDTT